MNPVIYKFLQNGGPGEASQSEDVLERRPAV